MLLFFIFTGVDRILLCQILYVSNLLLPNPLATTLSYPCHLPHLAHPHPHLGRIPKTTHDITLDSQRNCRMRAKGEEVVVKGWDQR